MQKRSEKGKAGAGGGYAAAGQGRFGKGSQEIYNQVLMAESRDAPVLSFQYNLSFL